jgi:RHS repeat-associated protein
LTERTVGLQGTINPAAELRVFHALTPAGGSLLTPQNGFFSVGWGLAPTWNGGAAGMFEMHVVGKVPPLGSESEAIAEEDLRMRVPPLNEAFSYDGPGRLKSDAFWAYDWGDAGRLTRKVANPATLKDAGALSEVVDLVYDADGRRIQKIRTVTFPDNWIVVEQSKVLWSGWLPVLEIRSRNNQITDQRWFQWGADLSGTLEGAGGIGGLVAIIEEKPNGAKRTLLPVYDGLGNVTGVVDKADGRLIARYDYGPFGEPLMEIGEVDACPFRYQTKWYDAESQQYYFGYRYYDPRVGRWLSRDPLGEQGGVNLYAYCGNDPVNRHDPLGLSTKLNIDGSVEFFDNPFNSHTALLEIVGLLDQRNGLAAQRAQISQSPLRGYGGYTALIDRQVGGLDDLIRSKDTDIKYRMTADLTRNMGVDAFGDFLESAYGSRWGEFQRQEILHGDKLPGPYWQLGETTRATEPYLAGFINFLVTLPLGGEGAALKLGSGEANAGIRVLFGQRRIGPAFSSGRSVSDVAEWLRSGALTADNLPIQAFRGASGELITINNRSLAALSEARLLPTNLTIVNPTRAELRRLTERLIIDSPLPGPMVPVTESIKLFDVMRVIQIP